jgi:endonuclease
VRLIVARCEVAYSGRLSAFLPESTRLLILKDDGSVLVHADAGGYKPLNWMTPPTVIEEEGDPLERLVVRKRAGKAEDRLDIRIVELLSDVTHEMGEAAGWRRTGSSATSRKRSRRGRSSSARSCASSGGNGRRTSARST